MIGMQAEADSISALKDAVKDVGVRATDYLTAIQVMSYAQPALAPLRAASCCRLALKQMPELPLWNLIASSVLELVVQSHYGQLKQRGNKASSIVCAWRTQRRRRCIEIS
jgi:hypothetical protein